MHADPQPFLARFNDIQSDGSPLVCIAERSTLTSDDATIYTHSGQISTFTGDKICPESDESSSATFTRQMIHPGTSFVLSRFRVQSLHLLLQNLHPVLQICCPRFNDCRFLLIFYQRFLKFSILLPMRIRQSLCATSSLSADTRSSRSICRFST